jgi:HSP20 family molecular chaperone IbpA
MYYNVNKMINDIFAVPHIRWSTMETDFVDDVSSEKDGSTKITVYVPGFAKEDFNLQVIDNNLKLNAKDENKKFSRTWELTDSADTKNISAECKNGILTINLPLKAKVDKSRTVEIK